MSRTLVIAEAGVNHDGVLERALELVDIAADAGADVVKFQTFKADKLATASAGKASYQIENTKEAGSQLAMLRALELSVSDHHAIVARCAARNIGFMSTAFEAESLAFLAKLDMPAIKIPSGDVTCAELLWQAARLRRPLIMSTGMATLGEIERALGVVAFGLTSDRAPTSTIDFEEAYLSEPGRAALQHYVTLLHCVTEYPAPPSAVNLRAMDTLASAFGLPVGYSDHTMGIEVSLAAVARGATTIEKHFTLDRTLPGPDHKASLEPAELKQLVSGVRTIEAALGHALKGPAPAEVANRAVARRSLVAAQPIKKGETFSINSLTSKRPASGRSPMELWDVVGTVADRDYQIDDLIAS